MKINEIIIKYIALTGCSSKDLAECSNLSESILSRYKNGSRIPSNENIKKISKAFATISNNKYKEKDILDDFYKCSNNLDLDIDFEIVKNNLNILITTFEINVSKLAKYLNFDSSYLSRIRKGERIPSNKQIFINELANYIYKKYTTDQYSNALATLINCNINDISYENIKTWIITNKKEESNEINNFLDKLDNFNLSDYIKAIKFDQLKVPNIPFYKGKNKNYYGLEEMKQGELDFFKATVLSKSNTDIFMCSDMPMEDMAQDIEFGKKWMFAIAMSLKKGLHLNIIHNLDRPFNEMMLGLESWIPIYMTGQISPYYLNNTNNNIYQHLNYVSGVSALTGECVKGSHSKGKYYITNNKKEIEYFKEKADLLLKKANPLMNIYREENINDYKLFLKNELKNSCDIKRYFSSLPLFTINNELLLKILNRNKLSNTDIDSIIEYKKEEETNIKEILRKNKIVDNICIQNENDEIFLSLENVFVKKRIKYNYDEYLEHLKSTKGYKNKNYQLTSDYKTFKNINISIFKNNYVIISKSSNPVIHFVIRHPKLVSAIDKFNPIVKES